MQYILEKHRNSWILYKAHDTISVTYYPEINVFQGRENLQVGHKELLLILALK